MASIICWRFVTAATQAKPTCLGCQIVNLPGALLPQLHKQNPPARVVKS
ncbi:MAG: hypothetical protein WBA41_19525 [Rivularia sp. (in: cyanobacteria)]